MLLTRAALLLAIAVSACESRDASRPETHCEDACVVKAKGRCDSAACERGCRFILDRLVEREGDHVVACVAEGRVEKTCDDTAWAECAVRVGVHADGGPPVPPSYPKDNEL